MKPHEREIVDRLAARAGAVFVPKEQEAMGKDVPEWAVARAYNLSRDFTDDGCVGEGHLAQAFARYIAAHEQPPVDWLAEPVRASLEHLMTLHDVDLRDVLAELRARIPNIDSLANAAGGGGK